MQRRLINLLEMMGLSHEEALIYLWLTKKKRCGIPELQTHTKLPYITVYRIVQKLVEEKFIEEIPLNRKQSLYKPVSLQSLLEKLSAKERKLKRAELELRDLLHYLPFLDLERDEESMEVEVRNGKDAFKEEYLKFPDLLKEEYLHIGNMANMWKASGLNYEAPEERAFIEKRLKKNIYACVLDVPTEEAQRVQQFDSREKRTLVLKRNLPIREDFLLIGERHVAHFICNPDDPRVIVLRSPTLLQVHKSFFESLWRARDSLTV